MYTHGLLLSVQVDGPEWLSTVRCTISQQYSYQHEVLLCALWSVQLQVGESGGHQVMVGQLPTHVHVLADEWLNG